MCNVGVSCLCVTLRARAAVLTTRPGSRMFLDQREVPLRVCVREFSLTCVDGGASTLKNTLMCPACVFSKLTQCREHTDGRC